MFLCSLFTVRVCVQNWKLHLIPYHSKMPDKLAQLSFQKHPELNNLKCTSNKVHKQIGISCIALPCQHDTYSIEFNNICPFVMVVVRFCVVHLFAHHSCITDGQAFGFKCVCYVFYGFMLCPVERLNVDLDRMHLVSLSFVCWLSVLLTHKSG